MTATSARRRQYRTASGGVVVVLVVTNVSGHLLSEPWWVRPLQGTALLAAARLAGLTWSDLGLRRDRLGAGCRWALGTTALVAGGYAIGLLLPWTRPAFQDVRYDLPLSDALYKAFVVIPLGTVVFEELAFRSVLWGALSRHMRQWQVLVTTSALFGLWHVLPSLDLGATNRGISETVGSGGAVLTAVVITTAGGFVFGELRRRGGSVLASAGAHWAFNALGVLFGLVAWRLDPAG